MAEILHTFLGVNPNKLNRTYFCIDKGLQCNSAEAIDPRILDSKPNPRTCLPHPMRIHSPSQIYVTSQDLLRFLAQANYLFGQARIVFSLLNSQGIPSATQPFIPFHPPPPRL